MPRPLKRTDPTETGGQKAAADDQLISDQLSTEDQLSATETWDTEFSVVESLGIGSDVGTNS